MQPYIPSWVGLTWDAISKGQIRKGHVSAIRMADCKADKRLLFEAWAKQRKKPSATAVEQTEEDQTDGEEEEWEREEGLALMRQSVYQDINLCHPLQYRGEDLCSLHRRGKLHSKFKIKELEDICQHFDLSVEGPKNRKVSFVSAISVLVQSCSCSKK